MWGCVLLILAEVISTASVTYLSYISPPTSLSFSRFTANLCIFLSLLKAFSNLTKSAPNPALVASLCGFAALQLGLGFHYAEESKRGAGGVDRWMAGGTEERRKAPREEDKDNFI